MHIHSRSRTFRIGICLFIATLLAAIIGAACGGGEPEELDIPVKVTGGKMTPKTIKVKQGDTVTLKIEGDVPGEFHLHTYDIEADIGDAGPVDMVFVAQATGRYRITFHAEDGEDHHVEEEEVDLGFLEVQPR